MKLRLPRGQILIPLAVLSLVVASFGAALPVLDPSSAGLSTRPWPSAVLDRHERRRHSTDSSDLDGAARR